MPRFLNTNLAYGEMQKIVTNAKKELVLISPYIKIPPEFLDRLIDAAKKIKITILCREEDLTSEEKDNFRKLQNIKLCFDEHLHAKCFYNEESMVIGSLNLYDHSVQNNHEMGILLSINDDTKVFNEAHAEAEYIVRLAEEVRLKNLPVSNNISPSRQSYNRPSSEKKTTDDGSGSVLKDIGKIINDTFLKTQEKGYCIRCGDRIKMGKPYCEKCYEKWLEWQNHDYKEKFCHTCGKENPSTMDKPLCRACYKKSIS